MSARQKVVRRHDALEMIEDERVVSSESERDRETSQAIVLEDVEFPGRNSNGGFLSSPRFVQLEEIETVPLSGGSHHQLSLTLH